MSREIIAKSLKRLREQSGLTAEEVGQFIGKSGKTVNAWENNRGQPDAEMLMKLCDIYDVGDILSEFRDDDSEALLLLTNHEKRLVIAYRKNPAMQDAVNKLLDVVRPNFKNQREKYIQKNALPYAAAGGNVDNLDEAQSLFDESVKKSE